MEEMKITKCELCNRDKIECNTHHLIPKTRHKNKKNKKIFNREEVKIRVAFLCASCHITVHNEFTEKELESKYNTIALLKTHPTIIEYVDWIKEKPTGYKIKINGRK